MFSPALTCIVLPPSSTSSRRTAHPALPAFSVGEVSAIDEASLPGSAVLDEDDDHDDDEELGPELEPEVAPVTCQKPVFTAVVQKKPKPDTIHIPNGIGNIPVIARHKGVYKAPSMVPGEGVFAFPFIEPEPVSRHELRELVEGEAVPSYSCTNCASGSHSKPCVFHGWGNHCDACASANKSVCSFQATPIACYMTWLYSMPYIEATPENVRSVIQVTAEIHKSYEASANLTAQLAEQYTAALHHAYDLTMHIAQSESPGGLATVLEDVSIPVALHEAFTATLKPKKLAVPLLDRPKEAQGGAPVRTVGTKALVGGSFPGSPLEFVTPIDAPSYGCEDEGVTTAPVVNDGFSRP
ncbi:hypothetical protein EDD18DRAFT_1344345 [Armillaria luteobubalina]|uniref:Uncharacterized protein n=1 Tax=Armillaria luteobubalina TaxID=153913 RepID=A0AA39UVT7_9AGAR|nr:hypothetical protein EDD18DRAFT_1344345 [Armillaria luteobubalina]